MNSLSKHVHIGIDESQEATIAQWKNNATKKKYIYVCQAMINLGSKNSDERILSGKHFTAASGQWEAQRSAALYIIIVKRQRPS